MDNLLRFYVRFGNSLVNVVNYGEDSCVYQFFMRYERLHSLHPILSSQINECIKEFETKFRKNQNLIASIETKMNEVKQMKNSIDEKVDKLDELKTELTEYEKEEYQLIEEKSKMKVLRDLIDEVLSRGVDEEESVTEVDGFELVYAGFGCEEFPKI